MSRANRRRRAANASRRTVEQRESRRFIEEMLVRPEVREHDERIRNDTGLLARVAADLPGQVKRLEVARWTLRQEAGDGAGCWDHIDRRGMIVTRILHSVTRADGQLWGHVSVSRSDRQLPDWYAVRDANWLLYPDAYGVVVVAPQSEHVNLREVAHVWTRLDGPAVPDFTHGLGTI